MLYGAVMFAEFHLQNSLRTI